MWVEDKREPKINESRDLGENSAEEIPGSVGCLSDVPN